MTKTKKPEEMGVYIHGPFCKLNCPKLKLGIWFCDKFRDVIRFDGPANQPIRCKACFIKYPWQNEYKANPCKCGGKTKSHSIGMGCWVIECNFCGQEIQGHEDGEKGLVKRWNKKNPVNWGKIWDERNKQCE